MAYCRWVKCSTEEVPEGRFWLPECWGGLYGPEGCYCRPERKEDEDGELIDPELAALERRISKLEAILKEKGQTEA